MRTFLEELSHSQKARVDAVSDASRAEQLSAHVMGRHDRLVLPLNHPPLLAPQAVVDHLALHDHKIHDYENGLALSPDGRRTIKIGKALEQTKATPLVKQMYATDREQVVNAVKARSLAPRQQIVISRHPYDVAGMSTGRDHITSCLNMDVGARKEQLDGDLQHGTHVAYLTAHGDDNLDNPIARIALRPWIGRARDPLNDSGPHTILRAEPKHYGTAGPHFQQAINQWVGQHFREREDHHYRIHPEVYDDRSPVHVAPAAHAVDVLERRRDHERMAGYDGERAVAALRIGVPTATERLAARMHPASHDWLVNNRWHDAGTMRIVAQHSRDASHLLALAGHHDATVAAAAQHNLGA